MTKPNTEFNDFNKAMDTILRADPAKVKAEMERDRQEREEERKAKKKPSASGRVSGGKD